MIKCLTKQDEIEQFKYLCRYCFGGSEGYKNLEEDEYFDGLPKNNMFGYFTECPIEKQQRLIAGIISLPFKINVRKSPMNCSGIQSVISKPQDRNKGNIRKLFEYVFKREIEKKTPVTSLYAFKFSYYDEKYGYVAADKVKEYKFKPESLAPNIFSIAKKDTGFFFKEVFGYKVIKKVYKETSKKLDFCQTKRFKDYWKQDQNFKFIVYDRNNEPVGYIVYQKVDKQGGIHPLDADITDDDLKKGIIMFIKDMAWRSNEVKHEIFKFIWSHRDQIGLVVFFLPQGEDIYGYFKNLYEIQTEEKYRTMFRVLLIDEYFKNAKFPIDLEISEMSVKIIDKIVKSNNAVWKISKKKEKEEIDFSKSTETENFDITLNIRELSYLVVGSRSIEHIREFNTYDSFTGKEKEETFQKLSKLFPVALYNCFRHMY